MLPYWIELLGSFFIIVGGAMYLVRLVYKHKESRKIWESYLEVSKKIDLEVKRSLNLLSNWPNLYGEKDERRVYIHPDKRKKRKGVPSKTIFAVENDIDLTGDVIIGPSDIPVPEDSYELDIQNLTKYKYKVYSRSKVDEDVVEDLFSKSVSRKIHRFIEANEENFRAIILEPGLAMFSSFGVLLNEENISEHTEGFLEIVEDIEKSAPDLNENLENPRVSKISKGTKSNYIKAVFPVILLAISSFTMYRMLPGFSFFLFNVSIVALLIAVFKFFVLFYPSYKYQ
ncbi:MAG: hypothetical protein KGY76_05830 [Candidatus Thermoplasmatota archaeon]|nr:hypothetical protein [Candidatus Thermoplasmatota archaeon]